MSMYNVHLQGREERKTLQLLFFFFPLSLPPLFLAGGANRNLAFLLWLYITISPRSPEARQFATPDN